MSKENLRLLAVLFIAVIFTSCTKRDCCIPPDAICCDNPVNQIPLILQDEQGNNLLDPENEHAFYEKEIKLFYIINNEKIDVNENKARFFRVKKNDDQHFMIINLSTSLINNKSRTLIQWKQDLVDTIDAEFSSGLQVKRFWINNHMIWDEKDGKSKIPVLIKK